MGERDLGRMQRQMIQRESLDKQKSFEIGCWSHGFY